MSNQISTATIVASLSVLLIGYAVVSDDYKPAPAPLKVLPVATVTAIGQNFCLVPGTLRTESLDKALSDLKLDKCDKSKTKLETQIPAITKGYVQNKVGILVVKF